MFLPLGTYRNAMRFGTVFPGFSSPPHDVTGPMASSHGNATSVPSPRNIVRREMRCEVASFIEHIVRVLMKKTSSNPPLLEPLREGSGENPPPAPPEEGSPNPQFPSWEGSGVGSAGGSRRWSG